MTTYSNDKVITIPSAFTALNGSLQYYTVTFTNVEVDETQKVSEADKAAARANLLRALETLRVVGGQPVVTKVSTKKIEFCLEQPNVYGDRTKVQPSAKSLTADAKAEIERVFSTLKAVDGTTSFVATVTVNAAV